MEELNALCVIKLRMKGTKIRTNIGSSSEQYGNIVSLFWLLVYVWAELILRPELITSREFKDRFRTQKEAYSLSLPETF